MRRFLAGLIVGLLLATAAHTVAQNPQGGAGVMRLTAPPQGQTITFTGFTFANIATAIPNNGMVGWCSDCTIANPCAAAGTGAIAKRLNGVNVCN